MKGQTWHAPAGVTSAPLRRLSREGEGRRASYGGVIETGVG